MEVQTKRTLIWSLVLILVVLAVAYTVVKIFQGGYADIPSVTGDREEIISQVFDSVVHSDTEKEVKEAVALGDSFSVYAENLVSNGPPPDGIPPIDNPSFVSVEEADSFLKDNDVVFVVGNNEEVKIYPQSILVYHEVVNDEIGGEKVSITYSPLSGSAIAWKDSNSETTFGTSGRLLNGNTVFYDRETGSLWPQMLLSSIAGERRLEELEAVPLDWVLWSDARLAFADVKVLSTETGFIKSYGFDPYGSYMEGGTYYQSDRLFFPIMSEDERLHPKDVVLGIVAGDSRAAMLKDKVEEERIVHGVVGSQPVVAVWDDQLNTARVYNRISEVQRFFEDEGSILDEDGRRPEDLERATAFETMWYAWAAYYPETELIQ